MDWKNFTEIAEGLSTLSLIALIFIGLVTSRAIWLTLLGLSRPILAIIGKTEKLLYGRRIEETYRFFIWVRDNDRKEVIAHCSASKFHRAITARVALWLIWAYDKDPAQFNKWVSTATQRRQQQ